VKKIGIVGSRRRNQEADFKAVFDAFVELYDIGDQIVSGGCHQGADQFAEIIAEKGNISILIHYPDTSKLESDIPQRWAWAKINYARNTLISDDSDVMIAAVAPDRKGGTEDTIKKFCKKNKKTEKELIKERKLVLV